MKKVWKSVLVIAAFGVVGVASTVGAQVADHLKCYKVKDLRGQTNVHYTLTLTPSLGAPFTVETGCQVQAAARNLCVPVVKSAVTPAPFPVGPGLAAQTYVCYNMRCGRDINFTFGVNDQLGGSGALLVKARSGKRQLCVPMAGVPTTTSTTIVVTTTSTSILVTTTSSSTTSSTLMSASPSFAFDDGMYFSSGLF